jgi:hypothetical protein
MLSALPKLADRIFVIGFFLPALLFALALLALFSDVSPLQEVLSSVAEKKNLENLVYFALAVWVLSVLLLMVNHLQYRVLEGYAWPFDRILGSLKRERKRFLSRKRRFDRLNEEWDREKDRFQKHKEYAELEQFLVKSFPTKEENLLPTRFGNAIRAFEVYSSDVYGADSIPLWPHLLTVMSKDLKGAIDEARAQVDFLVNVCFLSTLLLLIAAARLVVFVVAAGPLSADFARLTTLTSLYYALVVLGSTAVCMIAYRWSIPQIYLWGALVKAAFDCYLPALAERLGYQLPQTEAEQREFWRAVSEMTIYHRPMPSGRWPRPRKEGQDGKAEKKDDASEKPDGKDDEDSKDGDTDGDSEDTDE